METESLYDLMLASFSLMILPLQYLTAATLASRVKGRTDEEIRAFTGCYEEFTEDQLNEAEARYNLNKKNFENDTTYAIRQTFNT